MRKLIVVKKGDEPIANRDITDMEALQVQAVVNELKAANPGPELQWFKHTCADAGCSEKEFVPMARETPEFPPEAEDKDGVLIEKAPKPKSKKKK